MPRSRSMSMRSRYWARMLRSSTTPVSCSIRSASVDFPWSMWAMMQKFRMRAGSVAGLVTPVRFVGWRFRRGGSFHGPTARGWLPSLSPVHVAFGPVSGRLVPSVVALGARPASRARIPDRRPRLPRGEHQVPAQAHQDEREGAAAQQGGQVFAEDGGPPVPRGGRYRRARSGADSAAVRLPTAGQGREQGGHPPEPGGQQEVGDGAARQRALTDASWLPEPAPRTGAGSVVSGPVVPAGTGQAVRVSRAWPALERVS